MSLITALMSLGRSVPKRYYIILSILLVSFSLAYLSSLIFPFQDAEAKNRIKTNFQFLTSTGEVLASSSKSAQAPGHNKITPVPTVPVSPIPTITSGPTPISTPVPITPTPTSTALSPTPTVTPTSLPIKVGIVVDDYANRSGGLSTVSEQIGRPISTVSIFKHFGLPYNNSLVLEDLAYIKSQNMKLQLTWEPWDPRQGMSQSTDYLAGIPQGKHDTYLGSFASQVKNYGGPVTMRFGHEMNGDWYPWGNRPTEYINAYRYIVNYFRNAGVTNVNWMWTINAENIPYTPISNVSRFYPGGDVVDSLGIDGFNAGTATSWGNWRSFRDVFGPSYNYLVLSYSGKPIVIAETASAESGGDKAAWIRNMFTVELPTYFPKVREIVWFNLNKEVDWRINSSEASLQSFKTYLP